ncbi:GNAT family N-acetyltransferase [Botrimarina sp.]|uniref:GNAT family N-acetyltransferase n=1 Tax=Botrimarina sp. TaxID=2795802 RepID=UPI0032EC3298
MFPKNLTPRRLALRPVAKSDAGDLFRRVAGDPDATRYMSWRTNGSAAETEAFLEEVTRDSLDPHQQVWAICPTGDPTAWGTIGLVRRGTRVEMGYVIARELWGRGLMTEAATAVADAALATDGVWRVQAYCHVDHEASARVLEKAGFALEGITRRMHVMPQLGEAPQDCRLYARVRP